MSQRALLLAVTISGAVVLASPPAQAGDKPKKGKTQIILDGMPETVNFNDGNKSRSVKAEAIIGTK